MSFFFLGGVLGSGLRCFCVRTAARKAQCEVELPALGPFARVANERAFAETLRLGWLGENLGPAISGVALIAAAG
jgi:hypothetical protein